MRGHPPVSHLLIAMQFSGITLACLPTAPQQNWPWLLMCALGAALGVVTLYFNRPGNFSVYPEIKDGAALITNGPYRFVRHPMYVALLLMITGIACYNAQWHNAAGWLLLATAVIAKAHREEKLLVHEFTHYRRYAENTGMFLPRLFQSG